MFKLDEKDLPSIKNLCQKIFSVFQNKIKNNGIKRYQTPSPSIRWTVEARIHQGCSSYPNNKLLNSSVGLFYTNSKIVKPDWEAVAERVSIFTVEGN